MREKQRSIQRQRPTRQRERRGREANKTEREKGQRGKQDSESKIQQERSREIERWKCEVKRNRQSV